MAAPSCLRASVPSCLRAFFRALVIIAALALTATVRADSEQATRESFPFIFSGVVHIERGDVHAFTPVIDVAKPTLGWRGENGQVVRKGDPVIIADTTPSKRMLAESQHQVEVAKAKLETQNQQLQTQLAELTQKRGELEGELAVVRAALDRARHVDGDISELQHAEYERSRQQAKVLRRQEQRTKQMVDLGELAAQSLATAQLETIKADSQAKLSRLKWQRASKHIDSLEVTRLELEERELLFELYGGDEPEADGTTEQAPSGIAKRIEALERQVDSERKKNQATFDRAHEHMRRCLRDTYDHSPLNFIEILEAEDDQTVRQISFQPPDQEAPEGVLIDDGSVFDPERGYGWDSDLRDAMRLRAKGEPLQRGVLLIRGKATWRCLLPDGFYKLKVGLGDEFDWHTPLIRHQGRTLFTVLHLKEWQVVPLEVQVEGGVLELTFGDEVEKAMRAPDDGVVKYKPWLWQGREIGAGWPIAFLTSLSKYKVKALVREDMVPLLKVAEDAEEAEGEEEKAGNNDESTEESAEDHQTQLPASLRVVKLQEKVATDRVHMRTPDGIEFKGKVASIGHDLVRITRGAAIWWWGDEEDSKDLIAREVLITPDAGAVQYLHLEQQVQCTAWVTPEPQMRVLPLHLVVDGDQRDLVKLAGSDEEREIKGFRVGQHFMVTDGLEPDALLAPPMNVTGDTRASRQRFPGKVVAGRRNVVAIARYWGRIKDLAPDGSTVEKGETIITLYNPSIERTRFEVKEQIVKARQDYLVAIETRRVKALEAQKEHHEKLIEEHRARVGLQLTEQRDPIALQTAEAQCEQAKAEAELRAERYANLRQIADISRGARATASFELEQAKIKHLGARIDLISAERSVDWLKINDARLKWLDAVDALSLREMAMRVVRKEEQVARMQAELMLQKALEPEWAVTAFEEIKDIKAPVTGRIFYQTSWNDHARARTKIGKDFAVWSGVPIAEVLDMSVLGMEAELPEDLYRQVKVESKVVVGFDQFPGVEVDATVEMVGKNFFVPEDVKAAGYGEQAVNVRRVFTVKVIFEPPSELADELVPGSKGYLYLGRHEGTKARRHEGGGSRTVP